MEIFVAFIFATAFICINGEENLCEPRGAEQCHSFMDKEELRRAVLTTAPDAEVLKRYCSPLLSFMNCTHAYHTACAEEHTTSTFAERVNFINIVDEVCDEESRLHKDFLNSIDCVFNSKEDIFTRCLDETRIQQIRYREYLKSLEGDYIDYEVEEEIFEEAECLSKNIGIGCVATTALKKCGINAMSTIMEIVYRLSLLCPTEKAVDVEKKYQDLLTSDFDIASGENTV